MTLSTTHFSVSHVGDEVEDTFAYTFRILDDADLEVYIDSLLQTSGYSVTGVGDANGGTVIFSDPPESGATIDLIRNVRPLVQLTDLVSFGRNKIQVIEDAIDRAYMAFQELDV